MTIFITTEIIKRDYVLRIWCLAKFSTFIFSNSVKIQTNTSGTVISDHDLDHFELNVDHLEQIFTDH